MNKHHRMGKEQMRGSTGPWRRQDKAASNVFYRAQARAQIAEGLAELDSPPTPTEFRDEAVWQMTLLLNGLSDLETCVFCDCPQCHPSETCSERWWFVPG